MLDVYMFAAASVLMVGSALALAFQRSIMRAVVALALAFVGSSLVFFVIGQDLVALLQLFIFVGGLSTYLIVAVSSERKVERRSPALFVVLAVIISAGLFVIPLSVGGSPAVGSSSITASLLYMFQTYYALFYFLVLMLFAAAIGSVLVIRRSVRLVV